MPELPEVEVVKKSLERTVKNLSVKSMKINDGNLRYKVKKHEINKIKGLKILKIRRRSKYLLIFFSQDLIMLVHFGMTGKFLIIDKKEKQLKTSFYYEIDENIEKYNKVIFFLKGGLRLAYNDVRKFGFIKIIPLKRIDNNQHLKILGVEPLDENFNYTYFKDYIVNRKKTVKDLLMDQKFISGLGNIYVNEILFICRIRPTKKIKSLKYKEIIKLVKNIKKVLKKAINFGGSSIKNFSDGKGKKGNFQQHFSVYGKTGDKCPNFDCNEVVTKIIQSNRASFFCPKCQK